MLVFFSLPCFRVSMDLRQNCKLMLIQCFCVCIFLHLTNQCEFIKNNKKQAHKCECSDNKCYVMIFHKIPFMAKSNEKQREQYLIISGKSNKLGCLRINSLAHYKSGTLWNSLPSDIKSISDIKMFTTRTEIWLKSIYNCSINIV